MIDKTGVEGIFVARLWDPTKFHNYRNHKGIIIADQMLKDGLLPEETVIQKNAVSDDGLRWIRGQYKREGQYMSKFGEMALFGISEELSNYAGVTYSRKKLVVTDGASPGQSVQDAWWDTTEANGVAITNFSIYTYIDGTTPAAAKAIWYASANLDSSVTKTAGTPQTLTITRYETFMKA